MLADLGILFGVVSLSVLGSWGVIQLARRIKRFDEPNARSSHIVPTPRGGGIAIAVAFLAGISGFAASIDESLLYALLGGSIALVIVGIIDDFCGLARYWRLIAQCLASVWGLYCLNITLLDHNSELIGWFEQACLVLMLIWFINLYNFMDGIDGLAASEAIFVAISICLLIGFGAQSSVVLVVLIAASISFLYFNWSPALLFMGDSGSYFLGYVLGITILFAVKQQAFSIWAGLILLAVFIVDASYTLIYRLLTGDAWYQAHRTHAYQKSARRIGSHTKVTLWIQLMNCIWLLPCAWLALQLSQWAMFITAIAVSPLLLMTYLLKAGQRDEAQLLQNDH